VLSSLYWRQGKQSMKFILFIALLSISNAFAKSDCPQIKGPFSEVHLNTMGMWGLEESTKVNCSDAYKVANVINFTNEIIGNSLYTKIQYDLFFTGTSDNAFASIHLHVPLQLMVNSYSKHPKFTHPIWIHEYSHLLFNFNVSTKWQKYNKYNWYTTYYAEYQVLTYKLNILDQKQQTPLVKNQIIVLEKRLSFYEKKIENFENDPLMPPVYEFSQLTTKYSELFSDIVAVSVTHNPNAVSDALKLTGLSKDYSQHFIHNRDFDDRRNQLSHFDVDTQEPHNILAAVRYHIWKYYLSNPKYFKYRGVVISKLLNAIIYEMKLIDSGVRNYDAKTLNQRLINRINVTFSK
jgi:hypothetical protein